MAAAGKHSPAPSQATLWWEDFSVGDSTEMGRHTFTEEEIVAFARQFDPQPFHIDPEAAKASIYGGLIASGWHTCSVGMRMMCETYINRSISMGSPGVDNIRWLKPVRPGDTLVYSRTVLEARPSRSRPDAGLVKSRWEAVNQRGEQVLTMEGWGMLARKSRG
jgi:acyl dehydratase